MYWQVSKYIVNTIVRWPEATVIYHPFLNETVMIEGEVEEVFISLKACALSAVELLDNEKLQEFMGELDKEASLNCINAIIIELRNKELIEIVPLD